MRFQKLFLREFTKHLIKNSSPVKPKNTGFSMSNLKRALEQLSSVEKLQPVSSQVKKQTGKRLQPRRLKKQLTEPLPKPRPQQPTSQIQQKPQFSYSKIQPQPQPIPQDFDLGKLNILIKDPGVTVIQCPGENEKVIVKSRGQNKFTNITLNRQEIQDIVEHFSKQAKIPLMTGNFKAVVGNLIIHAKISDEMKPISFIINKLTPQFILEQQQARKTGAILPPPKKSRLISPRFVKETRPEKSGKKQENSYKKTKEIE